MSTRRDIASTEPHEWLGVAAAAAAWGVSPSTWRAYVSRGLAPQPDDPDDSRAVNRRSPRWRLSTIEAAKAARRGQGRRTDLA